MVNFEKDLVSEIIAYILKIGTDNLEKREVKMNKSFGWSVP